jgi:c-di-GMP-binding flagellar brake protein YcgR
MPRSERRRDARVQLTRPAKLRCELTGRFYGAQTHDLSAGGALIQMQRPAPLSLGQPIRVGVAQDQTRVILTDGDLINAVVVRSLRIGDHQTVAVRFTQPQSLALAG